jgi:hypothetical protein
MAADWLAAQRLRMNAENFPSARTTSAMVSFYDEPVNAIALTECG